ncbi:ABC transporter ATP-binding protein [Oceanobacillus manasiensis]|uniref:ABC transporter ATP-binding protein n=1 Tax=Oceanobacillus manasiensis TaxID=586413 RepID=UPI0005A6F35D|nr:ABC transporter ATP-binding protein [Oceanobacillus manasiensis]
MAILALHHLSKTYKKQLVLNKISLTIDSPGIWALIGPNGVGKTTLLNVITNILPESSGTVELLGESNKGHKVFKKVSFLQDNTVLFDYLTGYDHLNYVCKVHKLNKERVREVAEQVGMESYLKKRVGNYSLGMKQHLLLAMSIVNEPELLLLDEPLNGLDPTSAILMRKILLELGKKNTTIILSSHNLNEIDRLTKNVLFLKDGKLLEVDMSEHETVSYYFTLPNPSEAHAILREKGYIVEETANGIVTEIPSSKLDMLIDEIKDHSIEIKDIHKEVTGSEKLYEEVFGVRGQQR